MRRKWNQMLWWRPWFLRDPIYYCVSGRSFHSHRWIGSIADQFEGQKKCRNCGEIRVFTLE